MDSQKNQIIESLKRATNILVTVSTNPSVDQLAGAIGLALALNKMDKHATAVFSGDVPSTIEFLQPDKTLEKTTNSLRDFIIALDKSKADKLRYKVEDQMVKIFITPYRTSISEEDLEFSQGDFNVEVIVALGVMKQEDLDQAITSHGRILHDATIVAINTVPGAQLGSVNWVDEKASSLSEMLVDLAQTMDSDILDSQMATAFLTGIVAETNRFSNEKTSSETMQMSAQLMAAGANQQLVASQLGSTPPLAPKPADEQAKPQLAENDKDTEDKGDDDGQAGADGSLRISHGETSKSDEKDDENDEDDEEVEPEIPIEQIHIDEQGEIKPASEASTPPPVTHLPSVQPPVLTGPPHVALEPPSRSGQLTANSEPDHENLDPSIDPLTPQQPTGPMLSHSQPGTPPPMPPQPPMPEPANDVSPTVPVPDLPLPEPEPPQPTSPVFDATQPPPFGALPSEMPAPLPPSQPPLVSPTPPLVGSNHVDAARDAVSNVVSGMPPTVLEPIQALNAAPMDLGPLPAVNTNQDIPTPMNMASPDRGLAPGLVPLSPAPLGNMPPATPPTVNGPAAAPPPVPPPMMPPQMPPLPPNPQNPLGPQPPLPPAQ